MAYFALLLLVVGAGLGLLAYREASNALEQNTRESLLEIAEQGASIVVTDYEANLTIIGMIADRSEIRSMDWETQLPVLLEEIKRNGFLAMGVVQKDGYAKFTEGNDLIYLGDESYVKTALGGTVNISDVVISPMNNSPLLILAAPIYQDNAVAGVLIACRDGTALSDVTNSIKFGQDGYAYLLNNNGNVVAHPDKNYVLEQRNFKEEAKENKELESMAAITERIISGEEDFAAYKNLEGEEVYVAFTPVEGTPWCLAVTALKKDILSELEDMVNDITLGTIIIIISGLLFAFFIGYQISQPIILLSAVLDRLAKYDLTFDHNNKAVKYLSYEDEIGIISNAIAALQNSFIEILKVINDKSNQVAAASEQMMAVSQQTANTAEEISKTIEELASSANDQAQDTEEGARKIAELAQIVETNRELIGHLNQAADEVAALKDKGFISLERLMDKTKASSQAAVQISDIIRETNNSAEGIKTASTVIKNIADQTNLLALNAAIEAARAGEHGRGFAVVAEEVRKLAEQSNQSVQEIEAIIKDLTVKTNQAVETMSNVEIIVEEQTASVDDTKGKFEGIAAAVEKTRQAIEMLSQSVIETDQKKDEIIGIIHNLSSIAEENAAGTQEGAASVEEQTAAIQEIVNASEALARLAEDMQNAVKQFKY